MRPDSRSMLLNRERHLWKSNKMNNLTLAFLYNVRHKYPDPKDPGTIVDADFDDPDTISWMLKHFKRCGYDVIPIEANEKAYFSLYENREKIDIAFNYAEGMYGNDREAQIPAMLEMLSIPYTGSSPLTRENGHNKARMKDILIANNVSTLPFQVFKTSKDKLDKGLFFPLIVKPVAQGSSAGITNSSVVATEKELYKQVLFILDLFKQPALVEPFLSGREFSVPMIGNPPKLLPIIESKHDILPKKYLPLDSLEVKWIFEEESKGANFSCPAKISESLKKNIQEACFGAWQSIGYRDFCRIDLRCNGGEDPYVLDINAPGLIPPEVSKTSYFPLSARVAGIEYDELLKMIIDEARKRYINKVQIIQ